MVSSGAAMIIGHKYRYLFVELPRTGSTAVRRELRAMYDGEPILHKHSTYDEFLRRASPDEKRYFVFSTIRNPLDDAVSKYFKLRTDHKGAFGDPERAPKHARLLNRLLDSRMFSYVRRTGADFPSFFLRYYVLPYDTWASLSHERFDYVMRFERLADDFEAVLRRIGIEPKRPLPLVNPTSERQRSFEDYYPPHTWRRARRVFGPYMERWGYRLPGSWGIDGPTAADRLAYRAYSAVAGVYWRHIRPRTVRRLRR
jgi:hypothetical protein